LLRSSIIHFRQEVETQVKKYNVNSLRSSHLAPPNNRNDGFFFNLIYLFIYLFI